jgi:SAM-dependent methyltransferase
MGTRDPKEIVREGWNQVSTLYRRDGAADDTFGHNVSDHQRWLRPVLALRAGSKVLDLGCGCGVPDAKLLSTKLEVMGVDISEVQVARARKLVPEATFLCADMTRVRFLAGSFDAAICLYSIIHVPLDEQPALIERLGRWIRPGGPLILIAGADSYTGTADGWLGSESKMYWSHADGETYARWLVEAGFEVRRREIIPEGEARHELFSCRRTRPGPSESTLVGNLR